eukprot:sb/3467336/
MHGEEEVGKGSGERKRGYGGGEKVESSPPGYPCGPKGIQEDRGSTLNEEKYAHCKGTAWDPSERRNRIEDIPSKGNLKYAILALKSNSYFCYSRLKNVLRIPEKTNKEIACISKTTDFRDLRPSLNDSEGPILGGSSERHFSPTSTVFAVIAKIDLTRRWRSSLNQAFRTLLLALSKDLFFAITAKTVEVGEKCLSEDPPKIGPSESFKLGLRSLKSVVFEIQAISLFLKNGSHKKSSQKYEFDLRAKIAYLRFLWYVLQPYGEIFPCARKKFSVRSMPENSKFIVRIKLQRRNKGTMLG